MSEREDVEALAEMFCPGEHIILGGHDDCREQAADILASPWLADHDERVRAEAWDQGMRCGSSRAMRHMSDEPYLPLASEADNPYRDALPPEPAPDGDDEWIEYDVDVPMPYHLDLNNPPLSKCSRCGRSTWSESEVGRACGMPQPSEARCSGVFSSCEETRTAVHRHNPNNVPKERR